MSPRVTHERVWRLVGDGTVGSDHRVELLVKWFVAMSPAKPVAAPFGTW